MIKIAPSMMCAGIDRLGDTVKELERNGAAYLHIDIMDGHFVPNITLGTDYVREIRKLTCLPLDIHLMVEKPEEMLGWFDIHSGDIVSVHAESTNHLPRALRAVRSLGAKAFIALDPPTGPDLLKYMTEEADGVLVMSVDPGFAGQSVVASSVPKIAEVRALLDAYGGKNAEIEVDGHVGPAIAEDMIRVGADILVLGTSCLFAPATSIEKGMTAVKNAWVRAREQL